MNATSAVSCNDSMRSTQHPFALVVLLDQKWPMVYTRRERFKHKSLLFGRNGSDHDRRNGQVRSPGKQTEDERLHVRVRQKRQGFKSVTLVSIGE